MNFGKSFICLIAVLFLFNVRGHSQPPGEYKYLYNNAERLSGAANPTGQTDKAALNSYLRVIHILTTVKKDDPFLFKAYVSTGAFLQVLGRQNESINFFKQALGLKKRLPELNDSVLFRPLVYCGNAYYSTDKPDTAETLYKEAESIAEKYPGISELERLYNTLGVVSYSKGNYAQSIIYYQKAISTLRKHKNFDYSLLVTYKNNLASALKKLKKYNEALQIYKSLLPYHVETDKLFHNIGSVYVAMGEAHLAIQYLQKVKYTDQRKLNDLGLAYLKEKNFGTALSYLEKSAALDMRVNKTHKNSDYGITLKYLGDLYSERKQTQKALFYYQLSLINLLPDFNATNIRINPTTFTTAFNGIELLETLSAKAKAFEALYAETKEAGDLKASLQTFLEFYRLANYIERFYETDESRLLISDRKYFSRDEPIAACLQLFNITHDKKYIGTAFSLDEENKAGILSLYLEEAKIKAKSGLPSVLLHDELMLKENITRLSLRASAEKDSLKLLQLKSGINEMSIKLLKVQEKINQKTGFNLSNIPEKGHSIQDIQKIVPAGTAILSYHLSRSELICFVITDKDFNFFSERIGHDFFDQLKLIYTSAQTMEGNNNTQLRAPGRALYKKLLAPGEALFKSKTDLMIIPDNELNFLPFELLINREGKNVLNKYSVTYNYSCKILLNNQYFSVAAMTKLGMAPFAEKTATSALNNLNWLPASGEEIRSINGTLLFNKTATKQQFLKRAHNFNIIHLATHAFANDLNPEQSYILFYPDIPDAPISYKLYMPEIYNLKLEKTRLIVLSACETGTGKLANGEGLMSLSRAFSYSGCNNIITSMWKADDASTAYISGRLYFYLQKGNTIAEALRRAKLDYLENPDISPSKKLAGFWAHLRLTGNLERRPANDLWIYFAAIVLLAAAGLVLIKKGRLRY